MELLQGRVQPYAWGSATALPELLGYPPTGGPQAEVWFGTHHMGPTGLAGGGTLAEAVRADPVGALGAEVAERFGDLPFLVKVLAAEHPLSIQAHPSAEQARAGFAREEAAGIPHDAPERCYRDPNPKPELIVALTPFEALCGFRPAAEVADELEAAGIGSWANRLRRDGLASTFAGLYGSAPAAQVSLVRRMAEVHPLVARLAAAHPDDIGCVAAVFLRHVVLAPGEGLFLDAGNLHAYLHGVGVEVMANSDNVLRGGMTTKHVDVEELIRVVRIDDQPVPVLHAEARSDGWRRYPTPTPWFSVHTAEAGARPLSVPSGRPSIVLCTSGALDVSGMAVPAGRAVFLAASDPPVEVTGAGTAWWTTVP